MPSRIMSGLALLLLAACSKKPESLPGLLGVFLSSPGASSGPSASAPVRVDLPGATHATAGRVEGTIVTLEGDRVSVDGVTLETDDDLLVSTLRARSGAWKGAHPEAPAVLGLRLPRTTPSQLVTRLFRDAALAGYPRAALAVESAGTEAHLDIDTSRTPRMSGGEPEKDLHLYLDADAKVTLFWHQGDATMSALDMPWGGASDQGLVAARVTTEWKTVGQHRDPSDPQRDLASVFANNGADLAAIVAAYDAILATTRSFAGTPGPAFSLAFWSPPAIQPEPGFGPPPRPASGLSIRAGHLTVTGRLPPEVIQRIVRQNFGRFRLCYQDGLRRDGQLAGELVVRFTIRADGTPGAVAEKSSTLKDTAVRQCVTKAFQALSFPSPEGGTVDVLYPLRFAPAPAP